MPAAKPSARRRPDARSVSGSGRTLSDVVRDVIRAEPSAAGVARAAGVNESVVMRFLNGKRGLTSESMDRIGAALGLRLIAPGGRSRPTRPTRQAKPTVRPDDLADDPAV